MITPDEPGESWQREKWSRHQHDRLCHATDLRRGKIGTDRVIFALRYPLSLRPERNSEYLQYDNPPYGGMFSLSRIAQARR